jgi:dTDP-4-amino-4,6-dideoxygalactose transaminase
MDPEALEKCDFSRVLAVVTANLYGLPNDLGRIEAVCRRNGVLLLDDAAQSLGATVDGRPVGTFGDAGIYSFDRGKIISTMEGGALLCRNADLASRLEPTVLGLPRTSSWEASLIAVKLMGYSVLLRPQLYGVVGKLPWLRLGQTVYETRYSIARLSTFQASVAERLLSRLQALNDARRQRAAEYTYALRDLPGIDLFPPLHGARAAYARFPFRVHAPKERQRVLAALNGAGIGATSSYPRSIVDVPEMRSQLPAGQVACPAAREIASSIVTLPTHAYVDSGLAAIVRSILSKCLA